MEHHVAALVRQNAVHPSLTGIHVPSQNTVIVPSTPAAKRRKIEKEDKPEKADKVEPKGGFITPKVDHPIFDNNKVLDVKKWRIGFQRQLYIVQRPSGDAAILLGCELANPGVDTDSKNIELNVGQFKTLYGLLLSGKAQGERFQPTDGSDRLSPNYNLGDGIRFVWSRFAKAKADIATVRRFVEKKNGDLVPVANGYSFTDKYYTPLLNILKTLEPLKAIAAINPPEKNVVFHAKRLLDALTRTMYHYIYVERTAKCPKCITFLKEHGGEFQESRNEPGHTCVAKYGTPTGDGPVTSQEWEMAAAALEKNQVAEAFMLMYNLSTFKDISMFHYQQYLSTHRVDMMDKMNEYFKEFLVFEYNVFNYRNTETTVDYQNN